MGLSKAQTVIISLVIIFSAILLSSFIFAFYSSRKARKEDEETRLAVVSRWKEVGQVVVRGVPRPTSQPRAVDLDKKATPGLPPRGASLGPAHTPTATVSAPTKAATRPTHGRRFSGLAGIGIPGFLPDSKAISLQAERDRGLSHSASPLGSSSLSLPKESLSGQNGSTTTTGSAQPLSDESKERGRKGDRERDRRANSERDKGRTKRRDRDRGRERERGDSQRRKDKERRRR